MELNDRTCYKCLHRMVCKFYEPHKPDCMCNQYVGGDALKPKWIPVTPETMPKAGENVLTLDRFGHIKDRKLTRHAIYNADGTLGVVLLFSPDGLRSGKDVTHWMPLLDAPEEESNV